MSTRQRRTTKATPKVTPKVGTTRQRRTTKSDVDELSKKLSQVKISSRRSSVQTKRAKAVETVIYWNQNYQDITLREIVEEIVDVAGKVNYVLQDNVFEDEVDILEALNELVSAFQFVDPRGNVNEMKINPKDVEGWREYEFVKKVEAVLGDADLEIRKKLLQIDDLYEDLTHAFELQEISSQRKIVVYHDDDYDLSEEEFDIFSLPNYTLAGSSRATMADD